MEQDYYGHLVSFPFMTSIYFLILVTTQSLIYVVLSIMNENTLQVRDEYHQYFLYVCESDRQVVVYAVLFGYKGVLQVFALLLAFRTRNVKIKGLDDSRYIAASVYVTSIVLTVIIVSTYTLGHYVNAYPAVVGMGLLLGTTTILGLVFIPRVSP